MLFCGCDEISTFCAGIAWGSSQRIHTHPQRILLRLDSLRRIPVGQCDRDVQIVLVWTPIYMVRSPWFDACFFEAFFVHLQLSCLHFSGRLKLKTVQTIQLSFRLETNSAMATKGTELFKGRVPYTYSIEGTINGGDKFTIEGKGYGDSTTGDLRGKYRCTSGTVPISWKALAPLLGYGLK